MLLLAFGTKKVRCLSLELSRAIPVDILAVSFWCGRYIKMRMGSYSNRPGSRLTVLQQHTFRVGCLTEYVIIDHCLHSNSKNGERLRCRNRLGIRLTGPRPQFARTDGGEGGSHPSNVHDHVYALGTINFTGVLHLSLHFFHQIDGKTYRFTVRTLRGVLHVPSTCARLPG